MRTLSYLSYSSFSLWEKNPEEFYLRYLCEHRPPRVPQERPAGVGAAFDAITKASLYAALFGINSNPKYSLEALFEAQVESQNRDWAMLEGRYVFDCYKQSGFYKELLAMLLISKEAPRFEFEVYATINGIPVLCKPDARWITPAEVTITHDWKVNGYCSKSATSPHKSYQLCRDGYVATKQSKSHNTEHKEFLGRQLKDVIVNTSYLEVSNPSWADQLSLYGWSLGEKIGDENVVLSVHQIVAKPMEPRPQLRIAQFRACVASTYQLELANRLKRCWDAIANEHIFLQLNKEDSDARCAILDDVAMNSQTDGSTRENYFNEATKERYCG